MNIDLLKWAVVATCYAVNNGNLESYEKVVAVFNYPFHAEAYIEKCLPPENRDKFKVICLDTVAAV